VTALRQRGGDARGGLDAKIGLDQQVLKLLQRICIELPLRENAGDVLRQLR
jgi:hypothetical protein